MIIEFLTTIWEFIAQPVDFQYHLLFLAVSVTIFLLSFTAQDQKTSKKK